MLSPRSLRSTSRPWRFTRCTTTSSAFTRHSGLLLRWRRVCRIGCGTLRTWWAFLVPSPTWHWVEINSAHFQTNFRKRVPCVRVPRYGHSQGREPGNSFVGLIFPELFFSHLY